MSDDFAQQVASSLGRASVELVPVVAGAANLAYEVRASKDPEAAPLAFLRCQGAGALAGTVFDLRREGRLLQAAAGLGFPVAEVIATFDDPVSLLMRIVPGTSRPSESEIDVVAPEYLALIARLHDTDPACFPVEQATSVHEAIERDLEFWARLASEAGVATLPILAVAERVLRSTLPPDRGRPCVVHGDVGPGNFMIEAGQVTALLDWELAHVGDPHEDLAWLWMRGAHTDFGDPLIRLGEYEHASGRAVDHDRIRWHLAFVMWKSCISMEVGLRRYAATQSTFLQTVVLLTYEALLGSQVLRVLGGTFELLGTKPELDSRADVRLAERLLSTPDLPREATLIAEYLRDAAAQADWERRCFEQDVRETIIGAGAGGVSAALETASSDELLPLARVIARAADRSAMAMPKAVRRIERAMRIGLGTAQEHRGPADNRSES
jgi:aminoglycoside phosphotransferase (APT) family kinase protein